MAFICCIGITYRPESNECVLFKNGQWYNQDVISITACDSTIESGKLKFAGNHSGILVDSLSLPQEAQGYDIFFKVTAGANGIGLQDGTLYRTTDDLYAVIHSGANRLTYNNFDILANNSVWQRLYPATSIQNGVFFGSTDYQDENRIWYIEEIYFDIYDAPSRINW